MKMFLCFRFNKYWKMKTRRTRSIRLPAATTAYRGEHAQSGIKIFQKTQQHGLRVWEKFELFESCLGHATRSCYFYVIGSAGWVWFVVFPPSFFVQIIRLQAFNFIYELMNYYIHAAIGIISQNMQKFTFQMYINMYYVYMLCTCHYYVYL